MSYYIKQLKYHHEILSEINQNIVFGALPETLGQWVKSNKTMVSNAGHSLHFTLKDAFHPQPINWRQNFGS